MKRTHRADVVFALTGDVRHNSRALRQIRALSAHGLRIEVLSIGEGGSGRLTIPNTILRQIPAPDTTGPRFFFAIHQIFSQLAREIPARAYHASDLYALPALASAARKHDSKLVFDARELYPHVAATMGKPWARLFWRFLEGHYIRRVDAVFTVSGGIADRLAQQYDITRPTVLYNVPEPKQGAPRLSLREFAQRAASEAIILHQGQMREYRGCELLVDAMRDLEASILVFLGNGPLRKDLEKQAGDLKISSRVRFVDAVPPEDLLGYTASADVGVSLLDAICENHYLALPNKIFEYLTAGIPVVASDLPEIRKVIRGFDVGLLVQPGNREDLVAALNQAILDKSLRAKWRRNIPKALETFNWKETSQNFLHVYDELLEDPP